MTKHSRLNMLHIKNFPNQTYHKPEKERVEVDEENIIYYESELTKHIKGEVGGDLKEINDSNELLCDTSI